MSPPRLAVRWVEWLFPAATAEVVLGDLEEDFVAQRRRGRIRAAFWFWREVLLLTLRRRRIVPPAVVRVRRKEHLMGPLVADVHQSIRQLARRPGFTALTVVTLGLGLGAATGTFSLVNGVLFRPLPYVEPDRLVRIYETAPEAQGGELRSIAIPTLRVWQEELRAFEGVALYGPESFDLVAGDRPMKLSGTAASGSLFQVLGVAPRLGRLFSPEEERPGGPLAVLLSHRLWLERFGGDPAIVGQALRLNRQQFTVIGVMPAGFAYPAGTAVWVSLATDHEYDAVAARHLGAIGRLPPGVSPETATADLIRVQRMLAETHPAAFAGYGVRLIPLQERLVGDVRPALRMLAVAVALVLLLACVNAANLLLARSADRRREIALRLALGAPRGRLVRQQLLESLLLFGAGGGLGLGLAALIVGAARSLGSTVLPRADAVELNAPVLGFALGLVVVTGLLSGLVPAWQASAAAPQAALGTGRSTAGPRPQRARATLIVVETGLAAVLLVAAGLLVRSLHRLSATDPGFSTERLLTFGLTLPSGADQEPGTVVRFFDQVRERIEAVPGVESVAMASRLPLSGADHSNSFFLAGEGAGTAEARSAQDRAVSPGYFRALGIPLRKGREFTRADGSGAPPVIVINESFARRYFPGVDPIGRRVRPTRAGNVEREVIGVVGDSRQFGLDVPAEPEFYLSHGQDSWWFMNVAVRTTANPRLALAQVEQAVWAVDPELPLAEARTMDDISAESNARRHLAAICLSAFALMAYLLAAVGLYGVVAHAVTQRAPEIGIRMALGASTTRVGRLVVRQAMRLVVIGAVLGLLSAVLFSQVLRGLLFGVSGTDPLTYGVIALLLLVVGVVAAFAPAQRAMQTDPARIMRYE